jgi:hypothetical protein
MTSLQALSMYLCMLSTQNEENEVDSCGVGWGGEGSAPTIG